MVPGLDPVNTRVNDMLPGLEGRASVRNCHAHLTYGKTEAQMSKAIYEGTRAWGGAANVSSSYPRFSFLNGVTWGPLISAQKPGGTRTQS